jgi:hypothetical protein
MEKERGSVKFARQSSLDVDIERGHAMHAHRWQAAYDARLPLIPHPTRPASVALTSRLGHSYIERHSRRLWHLPTYTNISPRHFPPDEMGGVEWTVWTNLHLRGMHIPSFLQACKQPKQPSCYPEYSTKPPSLKKPAEDIPIELGS